MAYLKKVENAGTNAFTKQITSFGEQSLTGNLLKFTYCDANDFTLRPYGNLFSSFNFPITNGQRLNFATSFTNNAFTFFNNITNFIAVEIPENKYGELIDGKTFKLSFPINSGSSVNVIDCYATYFLRSETDTDTKIMDKQYADARTDSAYFGIDPATNELNSSNIAYLFSNQIAKPKINMSYTSLLSSSYTFVTAVTTPSYFTLYQSNKNLTFNFQQGKRYKVSVTNLRNEIVGYETQTNIIFPDKSLNSSAKFNATIGTEFFDFTDSAQCVLTYDTNTRSIRSFEFFCNLSASSINLHSQVINSRSGILDQATITIEEIVIEEGTWSRWTSSNKFIPSLGSTSGKQPARFSSPDNVLYDQPVGILYLDKGFAVITDQTLVSNFAYNYSGATSSGYDSIVTGTQYTGGTNFTQIYFNEATKANAIYNSIYTEFIQSVTCLAMPNEFYISNNPTFTEVYGPNGENNVNNDPVYITEIGLYNEFGELIAIAKTSEPIPKDKFSIYAFNVQLKL
jgi:hypothetical protein